MTANPSTRRGPAGGSAIAIAALLIAIGGGALVFVLAPALAARLGVASDLGLGLIGNAAWLLLAIAGAALLRARPAPGGGGTAIAALPLGIAGFAAAIGLAALAGRVVARPHPPILIAAYAAGTAALVFGALAEEALFRGFLQPVLVRAWGPLAAVPVAAAGFMLVHVAGGWRDPLALADIALAGAWFGMLAVRSGGLVAPILAHAGWNWAEALLFGASPNPGHDPAGSLFDLDLLGPANVGGSGDGMNAAWPTTLVLALLIAALLLPIRRNRRAR